jgi:hypothetical protein
METGANRDLTRAALLGAFDPRVLIETGAADGAARLRALATVATEVQVGPRWLWSLTPDARREGLARLPGPKARADLLGGLPEALGDPVASALCKVLSGGRVPPEVARLRRGEPKGEDLPELLHLLQAVELLRSAGVTLDGWAAEPDLARRLSRVTVQAYKAAAGDTILPGKLRGRTRELKAFHDFARSGQAEIPPFAPTDAGTASRPDAPPTVILSGLGGSGKSTLLEALRRRLARDASMLVVTFDLDEPALRAGHRVSLTQELFRQIGQERPALDGRMSALRQSLRDRVATTGDGSDPDKEASAVFSVLSELNTLLLAEGGAGPIRLVILFDTFEEALNLGPDRVALIADWIGLVSAQRLSPRVILSGREADSLASTPLTGLAVQGSILLGELGVQAGRALLRDRFRDGKVDALDLVPKLVETFGSDPLTLLMLARFARNSGKKGNALRKELTELASGEASSARDRLDAEMRQTFLFSRILNRLPPGPLQALASPGLVLRQITPQLIVDVLAKPCGLGEDLPLAEAEELFDKLAKMVWLVKPVGDRVVEHRPDLRRRMLPQVLKGPTALAVVDAAVTWFSARAAEGDAEARLESIYYDALRNPGSLPDDPVTLRDLADHLGSAVGDLGFARDRFRDAMGDVVSREAVTRLFEGATQKRAVARRRKYQLSEGLESAVLEEAAGAGADAGGPMEPELVAARFAALEIGPVAAEAPRLARLLLEGLTTGFAATEDGIGLDELQSLSVVALQAATACLAPEIGPEPLARLGAEVRDWLDASTRRETLTATYASALQRSSQAWPAMLTAVAVLRIAGDKILPTLGAPLVEAVRGMAAVSQSPYAWRGLSLIGPLVDRAEVRGIALPYLAPEVLTLLTVTSIMTRSPVVSGAFQSLLRAQSPVSITSHNDAETALFTEEIVVSDRLAEIAKLPAAIPGRLPEFHGAFRLALADQSLRPNVLHDALAFLARSVAWWPKEMGRDTFPDQPFMPTLISTLIDTADRCGRLPDLAAALARSPDATPACKRLSELIEATLAHYRNAAGLA